MSVTAFGEQDVQRDALESGEFRRVVGHFASGVTVVGCGREGELLGTTVNAFCSVSADPPMIAVCLNAGSNTGRAVQEVGSFVVNILADGQDELARTFAQKGSSQFDGVSSRITSDGHPAVVDALAVLECRVVSVADVGTHSVVVARVTAANTSHGEPLAYYRGKFGAFVDGTDTITSTTESRHE